MKLCRKCWRLNPDDTTRCINPHCYGSDFEPIDDMPPWLVEYQRELQQKEARQW